MSVVNISTGNWADLWKAGRVKLGWFCNGCMGKGVTDEPTTDACPICQAKIVTAGPLYVPREECA